MGSPPPAWAALALLSSVPQARHLPEPYALLADVPPTFWPPPGWFRRHARTPVGSARIVPLCMSCEPQPGPFEGHNDRKQVTGFMVYRRGQFRVSKGDNSE